MKAIISLEISSAGYSDSRRHVLENKVAILNPVYKIFLQYENRKKSLIQLKKNNINSSKTVWCSVFSVGEFTKTVSNSKAIQN